MKELFSIFPKNGHTVWEGPQIKFSVSRFTEDFTLGVKGLITLDMEAPMVDGERKETGGDRTRENARKRETKRNALQQDRAPQKVTRKK